MQQTLRWESKVKQKGGGIHGLTASWLDEQGQEGWELIGFAFLADADQWQCVFKRELGQ